MKEPNRKAAVEALVIGGAAAVAHAPALGGETTWDDQVLVFQNPLVTGAGGWEGAWSIPEAAGIYAPLTTLSFWIDRRLWGASVMPHQVENVALHACSAMVFARVLRQLGFTRGAAVLAAVLFAAHPVTVESVASIAKRENLLSTLLALVATSAFLGFESTKRARSFVIAVVGGVAALLASSALTPLPIAWLLLGWWRRGEIARRDVVRVAPLIVAALALGVLTRHLPGPKIDEDLLVRVAAAGAAVWFYLGKLLLPVDLASIYPRWKIDGALWAAPLLALVALLAVTFRRRGEWGRGPFTALATFVVALAPALGVLPMAYADRSRVADHLQYAPMLAVMALFGGWLAPYLERNERTSGEGTLSWIGACGVAPVVLALALQQSSVHRTAESLWTQALEQSPTSPVALYNRGLAREAHGDEIGALDDYGAAIAADPEFARALHDRGRIFLRYGLGELAVADFDRAIGADPLFAPAYANRGIARRTSDPDGAIADFTRAIDLRPVHAQAYAERGISLTLRGDRDAAMSDFTRAIELSPDLFMPRLNRGLLREARGDVAGALDDYDRAVALAPAEALPRAARARALLKVGRLDAARADVAELDRMGETVDPAVREHLAP